MIGRGSNWVLVVKCAWITANLSIWLLGLGSCMTQPTCQFAQGNIFPFLFLLSFPSSILFVLFIGPFIDYDPATNYFFLCLGTMLVGYFHWFHMMPALFGRHQLTVLGLDQLRPQSEKTGLSQPASQAKPAKLRLTHILAFDRAGHTPLERALNRKPRSRLTDSS